MSRSTLADGCHERCFSFPSTVPINQRRTGADKVRPSHDALLSRPVTGTRRVAEFQKVEPHHGTTRQLSSCLALSCLVILSSGLSVTLRYLVPLPILFVMTSIGAVTRQIAALEISSKQNTTTTTTTAVAKAKPAHQKQPSQTNVSKLLTKFAAPNVPKPAPKPILKHKASSSKIPTSQSTTTTTTTTAAKSKQTSSAAQPEIDIGRYDGGFEIENETRGQVVHGEAAKQLALDSSIIGSVRKHDAMVLCSRILQSATHS